MQWLVEATGDLIDDQNGANGCNQLIHFGAVRSNAQVEMLIAFVQGLQQQGTSKFINRARQTPLHSWSEQNYVAISTEEKETKTSSTNVEKKS